MKKKEFLKTKYIPEKIIDNTDKKVFRKTFIYKYSVFETVKKYFPQNINKMFQLDLEIAISDKIICFAYFGWKGGNKYPIELIELDKINVCCDKSMLEISSFLMERIYEDKTILYKMIDEENKCVYGHKIPYNRNNLSEREMYEDFYGEGFTGSPKFVYTFYPSTKELIHIEMISNKHIELFEPMIEISLLPTDELDYYDVIAYYGLKNSNVKYVFDEKDFNQYITYNNLSVYMKKWVEYICNSKCWERLLEDDIVI